MTRVQLGGHSASSTHEMHSGERKKPKNTHRTHLLSECWGREKRIAKKEHQNLKTTKPKPADPESHRCIERRGHSLFRNSDLVSTRLWALGMCVYWEYWQTIMAVAREIKLNIFLEHVLFDSFASSESEIP